MTSTDIGALAARLTAIAKDSRLSAGVSLSIKDAAAALVALQGELDGAYKLLHRTEDEKGELKVANEALRKELEECRRSR